MSNARRQSSALRLTIALCAFAAACATTHSENPELDRFPAGVSGTTNVIYYDVHGRTAIELAMEMRRRGPKSSTGASFAGETRSPLRWEWRVRNQGTNCSLVNVQVYVTSEITLPRWTPPADTVAGLLAQWNQFLAALEVHEAGHKDISGHAAADILRRLSALNTLCSALSDQARRITDEIVARERDEQVRYDADTRHGLTRGTSFPPRRVPPPLPPPEDHLARAR